MDLKKKIIQREALREIIGLGYVGLPRGREFLVDRYHATPGDIGMTSIIL